MYSTAVGLACDSAVYVEAHASSGIVDEMSVHDARQVVGHFTRAWAAPRDTLAETTSGARDHAVQLLGVTESAMVESCQVAKQVRMSRNEWFCDVTGWGRCARPVLAICDCRCATVRAGAWWRCRRGV